MKYKQRLTKKKAYRAEREKYWDDLINKEIEKRYTPRRDRW